MSADYFLEIEAHFANRRGTVFVLNAKDWALMQSWAAEGIPLAVVLEAIDAVFDKHQGEKTINGLQFFRHAVRDLWKQRKQLTVGAHEDTPEEDPSIRLEALASRLSELGAFADRVRALRGSVPAIEEQLIAIEHELMVHLATDELRAEAAAAVAGVPMDEATRARTEEAMLRRVVRERYGLPRLTLF